MRKAAGEHPTTDQSERVSGRVHYRRPWENRRLAPARPGDCTCGGVALRRCSTSTGTDRAGRRSGAAMGEHRSQRKGLSAAARDGDGPPVRELDNSSRTGSGRTDCKLPSSWVVPSETSLSPFDQELRYQRLATVVSAEPPLAAEAARAHGGTRRDVETQMRLSRVR